jgi:hypothetical protein
LRNKSTITETEMDDLEHLGMHIPMNGKMSYKMYTSLQVTLPLLNSERIPTLRL